MLGTGEQVVFGTRARYVAIVERMEVLTAWELGVMSGFLLSVDAVAMSEG